MTVGAPEPRPCRGRHVGARWQPTSFRQSLGLIALNAVLPGSAQLTAGHKVLGRVALTVWGVIVAAVLVALGYVALTGDVATFASIAVRPRALAWLRFAAFVLAGLWVLLMVDAWWLTRPAAWAPRERAVAGLLTFALATVGVVPPAVAGWYAGTQRNLVEDVFQPEPEEHSWTATRRQQRPDGRYNILLLGGDGGRNRVGVRTDSMHVASVDRRTGKTILVSLPRSLQRAPFPEDSPLARRFPDGFDAYGHGPASLLNSVYVFGAEHPQLFPGARNPGAEAIMQAASAITGLDIDYYVLVNLGGFSGIVEAIGGIDVYVGERVPIGGRTEDGVVLEQPERWIEPGLHHLGGYEALWFARGRFGSDDYSRMRRQRCVMAALLDQAEPRKVLLKYQRIATKTKALVDTNIPQAVLPELVSIALDARKHKIVSVTFTDKVVRTVDPNFPAMRKLVHEALQASVTRPENVEKAAPKGTGTPAAPKSGNGATASGTPQPRDVTPDLESVCRAP
ncbi:MAG: LCP family protein [Actinomycetota bacterium]|nr:LCP family protein [Actinomycetota bacterium]